MTTLRPYQEKSINDLRDSLRRGNSAPCVVAPTGSGKTVVITELAKRIVRNDKRVLFLAPRRELITQASKMFHNSHLMHGIIMAGHPANHQYPIQIASFDTLHARAVRNDIMDMPESDVIMIDEAHLSIAESRQEIIKHYHGKIIVGFTATPARGDGRGLGEIYDDLVLGPTVGSLTEEGHLVPVRYFAPSEADLSKLKVSSTGDYTYKSMEDVMDQKKIIGDIYDNWARIAPDKSTVIFCSTRVHSRHVMEFFLSKGVTCEHVDGETPIKDRKEIMGRVMSGETQVLCNVYVASYGLDIPRLECAVLARPTKNITLYLQTGGRVLRPCPDTGKEEAIIIDHVGAIRQHGFLDEEWPWTLDSKVDVRQEKEKRKKEKQEPKEIKCNSCGFVFKSRRNCPSCGQQMIKPSEPIPVHKAELKEVKKAKSSAAKKRNREWTMDDKRRVFGEIKTYAKEKGKREGWSAHMYRDIFGVWPNAPEIRNAPPAPVTSVTKAFITHKNIAWAKRRHQQ